MAQVTILTSGTDNSLSTEFTIGLTERAKLTLFPGSGNLDPNASVAVFKKAVRPPGYGTPSHNPLAGNGTETKIVAALGNGPDSADLRPVIWLADPGTYYVQRYHSGSPTAYGVYADVTSRYSG